MTTTKKLTTKELNKRIRILKNWNVKVAKDSIKEYKNELKKRKFNMTRQKGIRLPMKFSGNRTIYKGMQGGLYYVKNGKKRYLKR